jgi:Lar family restriction alleviation protein
MTQQLLPCPFCGSSEVEAHGFHRKRTWVVVCLECHAFGPDTGPNDVITEAEAVTAWNTRASL